MNLRTLTIPTVAAGTDAHGKGGQRSLNLGLSVQRRSLPGRENVLTVSLNLRSDRELGGQPVLLR